VLERHDFSLRPVEVIGNVGYLPTELVKGVANDPPEAVVSASKV
jgi:hypothetical protein